MSISVSEIVVVLLVALLVIKPEKLPDVAFKCGQLLKWLRQTKAKLQQEIETPLVESKTEPRPSGSVTSDN
jgi:Sec-independent protein translocase protein TatA